MRILLPLLFLTILPSHSWGETDCTRADAVHEDLGCALKVLEHADKELNTAYKALFAKMNQEGKAKLKNAQRAWIQFRDADVTLAEQNSGEGGSLGGLIATNHQIDLTLQRTRELKSFFISNGN